MDIQGVRKAPARAAHRKTSLYTSRFQKGGALLEDMRLMVRVWQEDGSHHRARSLTLDNLLAKRSRARSIDTYRRAFSPRFIEGDPPNAWRIVRPLEDRGCALEVVKPIYYWITARSEPLMYDFVVEKLSDVRRRLAPAVGVADAESWIRDKLTECGKVWSRSVTTKVAQGLLAALRDFGVLEGSVKKRLVPYYFPLESFAYLAFVLCRLGEAGGGCITHSDWRLFFLSLPAVERLFMEAHQQRLLEYYAAGSIIRVTFPTESLEEYSRVVTRRPY